MLKADTWQHSAAVSLETWRVISRFKLPTASVAAWPVVKSHTGLQPLQCCNN